MLETCRKTITSCIAAHALKTFTTKNIFVFVFFAAARPGLDPPLRRRQASRKSCTSVTQLTLPAAAGMLAPQLGSAAGPRPASSAVESKSWQESWLRHQSQLSESSWSREWQRLLVSIIKTFILIHWAFIIQIIISVLAGRRARDRNRSCHIYQMSKLFIQVVPDSDIAPDIVLFIRYRRTRYHTR